VFAIDIPDPFFYGVLLVLIPYLIGGTVWGVKRLYDHERRIEKLEDKRE
jgi:hypothetical protein